MIKDHLMNEVCSTNQFEHPRHISGVFRIVEITEEAISFLWPSTQVSMIPYLIQVICMKESSTHSHLNLFAFWT